MKAIKTIGVLLLVLVLNQCTSGKRAFQQGDYYEAVTKSVNRLKHNPNHKKSKQILRNAYPLALKTTELDADRILESNSPFKFCDAIDKYNIINQMYNDIKHSPGAMSVIPDPRSYFEKVDELAVLAAEERYEAGMTSLAKNTRNSAKNAYYHFKEAKSYVSNYKDVSEKIKEARFLATLKVVVEQVAVPSAYSLSSNFFQDQVESFLHDKYRTNEFVRFYTQKEADSENLEIVDQYMRLAFDDFVVGQVFLSKNTETFTRDSVIVGSTTLENGTEADVFGTVSAKLSTWHKETSSKGLLSMKIYDARSNALLEHQKFDGVFVWVSDWGNYNGDKRALTEDQLDICHRVEATPPPPQELFIEFTKPIYSKLTGSINGFYRRY